MNFVVSSKIQLKRQKYKSYSPTKLTNAYLDVAEKKMSVAKAARKYSIPEQTLRDRVLGHISIDTVKSGPPPVFDCEQEARLVKHIKDMGAVGYAYTRAEVVDLGTEYAVHLEIKTKEDKPLSLRWFYSFMGRWPELKVWRPKTISELRAKATSRESIDRYFDELGRIMEKYHLKDRPESIYNVDEKGLTSNYKAPNVVASSEYQPSTITSEKSKTTTVIGCGNALGQQIPPYFIFAGQRMRLELLEGATPGSDGTVSESGWSNSQIFQTYLKTHFIKYVTGMQNQYIMLLYDGHRTHIIPDIIDWAIEHKIILYVLPPHTSHILQPMDVGCFGPFSKIYSAECHKFQRTQSAVINRYNLCSIACKSYSSALSPLNLQSAFRKSGVYPLDRNAIDQSLFAISDNILRQDQENESGNDAQDVVTDIDIPVAYGAQTTEPNNSVGHKSSVVTPLISDIAINESSANQETFFNCKNNSAPKKNQPKKERRSIYKVVAGKAITEPETRQEIINYMEQSKSNKKSSLSANKSSTKRKATATSTSNSSKKQNPEKQTESQQPGCSGLQKIVVSDNDDDDDFDEQDSDDTLCCVCNLWEPKELHNSVSLILTSWAKCEFMDCQHWTHLKYCCDVRVLRRSDRFYCPCHGLPCKQNNLEE